MPIRFGTPGWRAVIADEFTFAGVRSVTQAICAHFGSQESPNKLMIVGHDTRFLGEKFAAECAGVISGNGFRALVCDDPFPTPNAFRKRCAGSTLPRRITRLNTTE